MMQRLVVWAVRTYVRGPGRSWLYTSLALMLLRLVRRVTGRRPVIERLTVTPGENLTVDHLEISHRRQIKEQKQDRRTASRLRRRSA